MKNVSCHYRRHLRGSALSVYEFALAVSCGSGEFYASVGSCVRETGYSRDTVSSALKALCGAGWLVALGGNREGIGQGGRFKPNRYQVIRHDAWAVGHPGACESIPIRVTGNSDTPVTGKSRIPVTGKPRHKYGNVFSKKQEEQESPMLNCNYPRKQIPEGESLITRDPVFTVRWDYGKATDEENRRVREYGIDLANRMIEAHRKATSQENHFSTEEVDRLLDLVCDYGELDVMEVFKWALEHDTKTAQSESPLTHLCDSYETLWWGFAAPHLRPRDITSLYKVLRTGSG